MDRLSATVAMLYVDFPGLDANWEVLPEEGRSDEVRLDGPSADALGSDLPEGTHLKDEWPRALPGLGLRARVAVLREASPPAPDRPPGADDLGRWPSPLNRHRSRLR